MCRDDQRQSRTGRVIAFFSRRGDKADEDSSSKKEEKVKVSLERYKGASIEAL